MRARPATAWSVRFALTGFLILPSLAAAQVGAPSPRNGTSVAWTGAGLIVRGGYAKPMPLATGARNDAATEPRTPMSNLCKDPDP
ncbi:MAG: hypothetical protein ACREO3_09555 [Arenimonas sp.]